MSLTHCVQTEQKTHAATGKGVGGKKAKLSARVAAEGVVLVACGGDSVDDDV